MHKTNDPTQEAFRAYKLEEEKGSGETFTIWISAEERAWLNKMKLKINQPKDSTAIKTLAKIGANLLGEPWMEFTIKTLYKNKRNNKRTGREEIDG